MADQITNYKCPACSGPLHFAAKSGQMECEFCGSAYSVEEIDHAQEKAKKTGRPFPDVLQETTGKKLDSNKKLSFDLDKLSQINQKMSQSIPTIF